MSRVFVDTCTCQVIYRASGYIYSVNPYGPDTVPERKARKAVDEELLDKFDEAMEALRDIIAYDYAVNHTFVLSESSLDEISGLSEPDYHQDVFDRFVLPRDHDLLPYGEWGKENAKKIEDESFSYLSNQDRALIRDALRLECSYFLTVDEPLLSNTEHLNKELPITVIHPTKYRDMLSKHFNRSSVE